MKDMNKAERMIWKAAQGQFNAFCEMALSLEQTTEERIAEIKKMAARKTY